MGYCGGDDSVMILGVCGGKADAVVSCSRQESAVCGFDCDSGHEFGLERRKVCQSLCAGCVVSCRGKSEVRGVIG